MQGRISADFNSMQTFESSLGRACEETEQLLGQLRAEIAALNRSWDGAANQSFQEAVRRWLEAADDLPDRLGALQRMVATARGNYQAALTANLRTWGGRT